jgi:hypothetical protein
MADFAQGLDASKLILAETVRIFQLSAVFVVHPSSHTHTQMLSFIISPYSAPPYNFPLFLFGLYVQESQEAAPRLLQLASIIFSQLTSFILNERTNDSLRVIWVAPLYSTSYGSFKTTKLQ